MAKGLPERLTKRVLSFLWASKRLTTVWNTFSEEQQRGVYDDVADIIRREIGEEKSWQERVRELCGERGFLNTMKMVEKLWLDVGNRPDEVVHIVGPPRNKVVPCDCRNKRIEGGCPWCAGVQYLPERVAQLKREYEENPRDNLPLFTSKQMEDVMALRDAGAKTVEVQAEPRWEGHEAARIRVDFVVSEDGEVKQEPQRPRQHCNACHRLMVYLGDHSDGYEEWQCKCGAIRHVPLPGWGNERCPNGCGALELVRDEQNERLYYCCPKCGHKVTG